MEKVKVYTDSVIIPTYETGKPDTMPMFLDRRIYQGASGKIYPHSLTETISDEKTDKEYEAIYLENDYLLVMILPSLGGRIHRIYDKLNKRDAVYYNDVIKPALAGFTGPWIAGGVEFSWPQHHRPSALEPVDYWFKENKNGSAAVYVSKYEHLGHTKGMAAYIMYPDRAYLEVKGQLYNPTERDQSLLWWSNAAVRTNENTKLILPPDVSAVMDYGNREVSKYPVATGRYYKVDYGEGVDISEHKNIPAPTSFVAYDSKFDFIGCYDKGEQAGIMHIADHHIAPGKKQWTWGSGEFGRAWESNLMDDGGSYAEIMSGAYANNQPDFVFIAPYEEKHFTEYFMPYREVGEVKNATTDALINLEFEGNDALITVYSPKETDAVVKLKGKMVEYLNETTHISPEEVYKTRVDIEDEAHEDVQVTVTDTDANVLVAYTPVLQQKKHMPAAAKPVEKPEKIASLEELYLVATHLEQNKHATCSPEPYYLEGLKRDCTDIRLNNGYGKYLYRRGRFTQAEKYFRAAVKKSMMINPTPYDCEPFYNLGVTLKALGRTDEAYDALYKSVWSSTMQDRGFYQLACICAGKGMYETAIGFLQESLGRGYHNIKARNLMSTLYRLTGKKELAINVAKKTMRIDPMDCGARYELYRITGDFDVFNELSTIMRGETDNYIQLSINYSEAGLFEEAARVLATVSQAPIGMLHYYIAYYSNSEIELEIAAKCTDTQGHVNRLYDINVLEYAIEHNPDDAAAPYLLGNLLYDKGQCGRATELWEKSAKIDPTNAVVYRNLAIAYFNCRNDQEKALRCMEKALRLEPNNSRLFYEADCLRKEMNYPMIKRAVAMADNQETVSERDDLYTEFVTLVNSSKQYDKALALIKARKFHPWEGREGLIGAQYKKARIGMAIIAMKKNDCEEAIEQLKEALKPMTSLGEGRLTKDNDVYYYLGCAYETIDKITSIEYLEKAKQGEDVLDMPMYYNDVPAEMTYYRALAHEKLGDSSSAKKLYNKMINYAEEHIDDHVETDYFAVTLPQLNVFHEDMDKKNFVHCAYLAALGYKGLGNMQKSDEYRELGLTKDNAHQGLLDMTEVEVKEDVNYERWAKWNPSI